MTTKLNTILSTSALTLVASLGLGLTGGAHAQMAQCSGEASYRVTFTADWNADSANVPVHPNAHFSPLVVATHNSDVFVWRMGEVASAGVKVVAETGKTGPIKDELNAAFSAGDIRAYRTGSRLDATGSTSVELNAAPDRPYVSALSMIAPSPDWFVGVDSLSLCNDGEWVTALEIPLGPIDGGSDSGETYGAGDQPTTPAQPIQYLNKDFELGDDFGGAQFGTLSVQKL